MDRVEKDFELYFQVFFACDEQVEDDSERVGQKDPIRHLMEFQAFGQMSGPLVQVWFKSGAVSVPGCSGG